MLIYSKEIFPRYTEKDVLDCIYKEVQELKSDVARILLNKEYKSENTSIYDNDWIYVILKKLQRTIADAKFEFNVDQDDIYIEHFADPEMYALQIYMSSYTCRSAVRDRIEKIKKDIVPKALENKIFIDIFLRLEMKNVGEYNYV